MRRFSVVGLALLLAACQTSSVYEPQADREGIKRVIYQHRRETELCYERAIDERPGAEGKIVMSWDVTPEGTTAHILVKSADEKIVHISPCLTRALASWKFPQLSENEVVVVVSYPFFFSENGRLEVK